jgi:hypothetical protein
MTQCNLLDICRRVEGTYCLHLQGFTDVSEEHIISIFRVEEHAEQPSSTASSETSVNFHLTVRWYIPEDSNGLTNLFDELPSG